MINDRIPREPRDLIVARRPIELVLVADSGSGLSLILPPLEDLLEMRSLRDGQFSLKDLADVGRSAVESELAEELRRLQTKWDRFADSSTFLVRLANLAELSGRRQAEFEFLERAANLDTHVVLKHRIGDNLLARNQDQKAEEIFRGCQIGTDVYANLRIAYMEVQRKRFDEALKAVERGVSIDPLHFGARLFHGALCLSAGEFERAVHSFRVAQKERPNSSVLHANMAVAYLYLNRPEKAFSSLKLAVSFDPFNKNAVALLADLSFSQRRNEEAVPALRYFLNFEQKDASMWARLARSLLELGETNEAISALKRQGSLEDTSAVWNNLGVAYTRAHDRNRALKAFNHAVTKDDGHDAVLAARNLAFVLLDVGALGAALKLCERALSGDPAYVLKDRELSDFYVAYVIALERLGDIERACGLCEEVLKISDAAINLRAWLVTALIANYALDRNNLPKAIELLREADALLTVLPEEDKKRRDMLLNNAAFACAEAGLVDQAERYLEPILSSVHREPYPTATLGLIRIRRGQFEKGAALYEEAVRLAANPRDKARVRQKLNLENAITLTNQNPSAAARYLKKVVEEKNGSPQLVEAGRTLIGSLPMRH